MRRSPCWATAGVRRSRPPKRSLRLAASFLYDIASFTGGKLALLALSSTLPSPTPFKTGAIVHPAMISPDDGNNLAVPLAFYPSMDESRDVVEKIHEAMVAKPFAKSCDFKLYSTVYVKLKGEVRPS